MMWLVLALDKKYKKWSRSWMISKDTKVSGTWVPATILTRQSGMIYRPSLLQSDVLPSPLTECRMLREIFNRNVQFSVTQRVRTFRVCVFNNVNFVLCSARRGKWLVWDAGREAGIRCSLYPLSTSCPHRKTPVYMHWGQWKQSNTENNTNNATYIIWHLQILPNQDPNGGLLKFSVRFIEAKRVTKGHTASWGKYQTRVF